MSYDSGALSGYWALILGASSGFGEATSLKLAKCGMNIIGVHLDRKATIGNVERITDEIRAQGCEALFFNANAADSVKREAIVDEIAEKFSEPGVRKIRVLMHSLAFGALKPFISAQPEGAITKAHIDMTMDVMANSLVYWTQDMVSRDLMEENSRIFAMTSAGDYKAWPSYGAVSAAKAALDAHIRQLALELAPKRITANAIRAGVTDTPALRKIPEAESMIKLAQGRNPMGRLTEPNDVANVIALLSHPDAYWITGNVVSVDGGEMLGD